MPGQTTPPRRRAAICAGVRPSAARISSVSSPSSGGGVRIVAGVRDEPERDADLADDAPGRVLLLDGHPERGRLGRREGLDDVVDRPARDARRLERGEPRRRDRARGTARRGSGAARPDARRDRRSSRIAGRRRRSGSPSDDAEPPPLPLGADRDRDRAVGGLERLVRARCSGGRCRSRPGATPVTNAFWAWLTRLARVAPSSEMSIRWPPAGPRRRRGPGRRRRSSRPARAAPPAR